MASLFHLIERDAWESARQHAEIPPAAAGFVHLSTEAQWLDTANRFFRGKSDVVLLELRTDLLGADVRYEAADGALFPHLYGALPLDAVIGAYALPLTANGEIARPGARSPVPAVCAPAELVDVVRARGFGVVDASGLVALTGVTRAALDAVAPSWNALPRDAWLKDGGKYRARRHACFVVTGDVVERAPHRAHWQSVAYNALHGGIERWFEPIADDVIHAAAWSALLRGLAGTCSTLSPGGAWFVEAHQFRIDTADGIGRPTPEGAHRDGVDFAAVILVDRRGVKGGETRVFDAHGPAGVRFSLIEPWSMLLLDDARVIHETTPLLPLLERRPGWRDTLVLTFRRGGFQGP